MKKSGINLYRICFGNANIVVASAGEEFYNSKKANELTEIDILLSTAIINSRTVQY